MELERIVSVDRVEDLISVFGSFDENIKRIEEALSVSIINRGNELKVTGEPEDVDKAARALDGLLALASKGETIDEQRVRYLITLVKEGNDAQVAQMAKDVVCITAKGKPIKAKTVGQQNYMKAIMKNTVTIGVGPAGTGKTYLAVAAAVAAFRERIVNRIILTRPAVEAGERLGFLPGDLQNKVDPYLRPLYDALYDMLGAETFQKYQERGSIEVAPLAYMRGRTLDDSFIILDEAQNTTKEQMKMFLTRLGFGSKIVITGDVTQIDLPSDKTSGLKDAISVLENVKDISICRLTSADVVRHALVQEIINAYEKAEKKREIKKPDGKPIRYQRKRENGKN
ncbi:MAG: PhoH family protein [Oscillospiraceae bacterium]|nr:PhoH family protein [Oscillospiraceae bacterium]